MSLLKYYNTLTSQWVPMVVGISGYTGSIGFVGSTGYWGSVGYSGSQGYTTITAGTDTAVSSSTGTITVWNTSNLQSVTDRGSSTTNAILITNTEESTLTTTGALVVSGGVGVGGNLNVDKLLTLNPVVWNYVATTFASIPVTYGQTGLTFTVQPDNTITDISVAYGNGGYTINSVNLVIPGTTFPGGTSPANDIVFNVETFESPGPVYSTAVNSVVSYVSGTPPKRYDNIYSTGSVGIGAGEKHWVFGTDGKLTAPGTVVVRSTNSSISTTTGALTVTGGVGVGGDVYVGGSLNVNAIYDTGNRVVTSVIATGSDYIGIVNLQSTGTQTSFGIVNLGVQTITAGTDTAVSSSTGTITVWTTSTLQTITNRGNTTTNRIVILNTLSTVGFVTENALYVAGGVGIGGNLTVSGPTLFEDNVTFTGTATYVLTTNTVYTDNIIELHSPGSTSSWMSDDGADVGFTFRYFTTSDQRAGLIFSHDTRTLEFYSQGIESIENTTVINNGIYGAFKTGTILIDNNTTSTNTTTGALIVAGGVGIGGDLNVGGSLNVNAIYDTGNRVVTSVIATGSDYISITNLISTGTQTSFTIVNLGVQTITAGTDTAVSSNTGTVTVWTTSTLQSITNRGATTTNIISITNTTNATSTTTGALVVSGGVGIGGDVWAGGVLYAKDLGSPTNRIGKIYLEGQTIDIGGTLISTALDGGLTIQKPNGDLEKLATSSLTLGSTGTGSVLLSVVDGSLIIKSNTVNVEGLVTTGTVTATNIIVNGLTSSTSTNTGALIVSGGVGISGSVYAGPIYDSDNRVVTSVIATGSDYIGITNLISTGTQTSFTVVNLGVQTLTAGTDTAVSSSTGTVTVWTTSTLQSVTNRGATTTNIISITNTTNATSTTTGALVVSGGVGIGGDAVVSGLIYSSGSQILTYNSTQTLLVAEALYATTASFATTSGFALSFDTSTVVTTAINATTSSFATTASFALSFNTSTLVAVAVTATSLSTDIIYIVNLTSSTSTNTGALIVSGGVGIGGALYVNTTSFIAGAEIITSATINTFASKTTIVAGTDTAINTSTGEVTIWTTSTLQSITDRGNSTTNTIIITNSATSTSSDSGALQVVGGVGIGGTLYVNTTSFVANAEILTTGTIELYAVTPTGIQTLTNKTIIVPSGGALYFEDDVAEALAHNAGLPYKQTSAAPRMFTNASFGIVNGVPTYGAFWANTFDATDYGYNTVGSTATNADLPTGYTGMVYDAYTVLDTGYYWLWMPLSQSDLKPGDYFYDDVLQKIYICYEYTDPNTGLPVYNLLDITPRA